MLVTHQLCYVGNISLTYKAILIGPPVGTYCPALNRLRRFMQDFLRFATVITIQLSC